MSCEALELSHRTLLHPILKAAGTTISEYSFANLFLFRKRHDYRVVSRESLLFILGRSYDNQQYSMPLSDLRRLPSGALEDMLMDSGFLFPIPEEWLSVLDRERYHWINLDSDSDYIYPTERICTYRGNIMHSKKNLRNRFLGSYHHEEFPLTVERLPDAYQVLDVWQAESNLPKDDTDYFACREALEWMEELQLCGGIYYAGGQPAGFILGEELGREMFVIHFAKGLTGVKGVYQFLFSHFACIMPGNYRWLNFEQDLGKEGLRQSKQSYVPEFMQKKYRVSLRPPR